MALRVPAAWRRFVWGAAARGAAPLPPPPAEPGPHEGPSGSVRVEQLIRLLVLRLDAVWARTPLEVIDAGGWGAAAVTVDRERLLDAAAVILRHVALGAPPEARARVDFGPCAIESQPTLRIGFTVRPPAATAPPAGTLGWAMAARVVRQHGGDLRVEGPGRAALILPLLAMPDRI